MPRNGSGVYTPPANSVNPAIPDTEINATDFNATLSDLSEAMTDSIAADGQTTITADLSLSGHKLTDIGEATTTGDALSYGRVATLPGLVLSKATEVVMTMTCTSAPLDTKSWQMSTTGLAYSWSFLNDAGTIGQTILNITRVSGTSQVNICALRANIFGIYPNGLTDYAFQVVTSASSSATGVRITSAAAAGGVNIAATSSGTNEGLTIDAKGSGTIVLGGTSTGAITLSRATTLSAALTYGGVALSNSVSGTGSMALTANTTFTGTTTAAGIRIGAPGSIQQDPNTVYFGANFSSAGNYLNTAFACQNYFDQSDGTFTWRTAASGTAGNPISFNTRAVLSNAGAWRWHAYGAGAITSDASGNLTSVSDETLKHIQGPYSAGLAEIAAIKPIVYKWNAESGMEMEHDYAGFSAQNIRDALPLSTGVNGDGKLSLQERAIIAALVNAVNELSLKIKTLEAA